MKKSSRKILIYSVAVLALAAVVAGYMFLSGGNSFKDYDNYDYAVEESFVPTSPQASLGGRSANLSVADQAPGDDGVRLILRNGSLSMVVDNVKNASKEISDYVIEKGGFVVSSNVSKGDVEVYGDISVRIPVDDFDSGVVYFKEMGEVTSESVYGQDVTEEYVDLSAQLGNLQATEAQFLKIMDDAKEIEDVLAVQRELSNVRSNIERLEGRVKYLTESARLATLTIYLSTDPGSLPVLDGDEQWKPLGVFKDALRSLIGFAKGFANFVIWIAVYIPAILAFALIFWGVVRLVNRKKKGKK